MELSALSSLQIPQLQTPTLLDMKFDPKAGQTSGTADNADSATEAANEFESVYLSTVFNRMMSSIPTDGVFGGGNAEATWRSFLANEYASEVTRKGGIGLADAVRSELVTVQEAAQQ